MCKSEGSTEWSDLCQLYLDGELESADHGKLFAHLGTCAECRREMDGVLSFRSISREDRLVVPAATDEKLFARVERRRKISETVDRHKDRSPLWQQQLPVSLRAGLLAFLAVFILGALTFGPEIVGKGSKALEPGDPDSMPVLMTPPVQGFEAIEEDSTMPHLLFYPPIEVQEDSVAS